MLDNQHESSIQDWWALLAMPNMFPARKHKFIITLAKDLHLSVMGVILRSARAAVIYQDIVSGNQRQVQTGPWQHSEEIFLGWHIMDWGYKSLVHGDEGFESIMLLLELKGCSHQTSDSRIKLQDIMVRTLRAWVVETMWLLYSDSGVGLVRTSMSERLQSPQRDDCIVQNVTELNGVELGWWADNKEEMIAHIQFNVWRKSLALGMVLPNIAECWLLCKEVPH